MPSSPVSVLPSALTVQRRRPVRGLSPRFWIITLSVEAAVLVAVFMTIDLRGNIGYVLPRRAIKVGSMILVAYAVGVSTVLFQTVTANRILTPSIMGFDALYVLIQTVLVFTFGGGLVLDGEVYRGANGVGAEIGHMRVVPHGIL